MQRFFARCFMLVAVIFSSCAYADGYPLRPVRMIVPSSPGGVIDTLARAFAEKLRLKWDQPVVVDNRTGATGNIAAETVFRATPDGYTFMFSGPATLVVNKSIYARLNYDPEAFVPVSVLALSPTLLVVNPGVTAQSVRDLIRLAKEHPGRLNYGSMGNGSVPHLATEQFKSMTGTQLVHVPYKGVPPALAALLGGQIDVLFVEFGTALPQIRAGKVRVLGVGTLTRNPLLPDVPSVSETIPGFVAAMWIGMVAPPRTPSAITRKVSGANAEILKQADMAKRLADASIEPVGSTPEEMAHFLKQERERWSKVVRASGIVAN